MNWRTVTFKSTILTIKLLWYKPKFQVSMCIVFTQYTYFCIILYFCTYFRAVTLSNILSLHMQLEKFASIFLCNILFLNKYLFNILTHISVKMQNTQTFMQYTKFVNLHQHTNLSKSADFSTINTFIWISQWIKNYTLPFSRSTSISTGKCLRQECKFYDNSSIL